LGWNKETRNKVKKCLFLANQDSSRANYWEAIKKR